MLQHHRSTILILIEVVPGVCAAFNVFYNKKNYLEGDECMKAYIDTYTYCLDTVC